MEMNQEIKKSKKRFPIGLAICLTIVAVCAVVTAGAVIVKNIPSFQKTEITSTMEVADAKALREALLADAECTITITEDIVVTEELYVNGKKTLVGDKSIIMDINNIGSGQSVCAVNDGAVLVLDGPTIDGNCVVNGVAVKYGGKLIGTSGDIVYGYPYGISTAGVVEIEDVTIDRAMHTGIYAEYGGEVTMTGGTVSNNVYGVSVASGAYMSISGEATFTKTNATIVTNYGKMDITGGSFSDCFDNVITNQGEMSIKGEENNKIELANSKRSAIVSKKNSKLTVENCYMHDLGLHGLAIEKGSEGSVVNCVIERTGKSSFYVNSSTLAIKDVEVSGGESYGLNAVKQSKIEMENVTIKDMKSRGVGIDESSLVAKKITITDTKSTGLYVIGDKAVVEVEDITLTKNGASAFAVLGGKATGKNVNIDQPKNEGIYVKGEKTSLKIENATVDKTGMNSVINLGGTITANKLKVTNSNNIGVKVTDAGTVTLSNSVITNSKSHALCVEKDSVAKVNDCDIDKTGKAAVYVSKSKLNMNKSKVDNAATYAIYASDCLKSAEKSVLLEDITISKPGDCGIGNVKSYVVMTNVKIDDAKQSGLVAKGAESITNMNQIEVNNAGNNGFGFAAGTATARNVTITKPKKEGVYLAKTADVKLDNVVITEPGTNGIGNYGGTLNITVDEKYNPDNKSNNGITIEKPGKQAIHNEGGALTASYVTAKNVPEQSIYITKESKATINHCVIENSDKAAVYVKNSNLSLKNAKIDGAKTYGVYATEGGKTILESIEITKPGERGIGNENSAIVMTGVKITESKGSSIYTAGANSVTNMNEVELVKPGVHGLGISAGTVTARNIVITKPAQEGVYLAKEANVQLDNAVVTEPGTNGVGNYGGTLKITVDAKYNPENTAKNGITITKPGKQGMHIEGGNTTGAYVTIKETPQQAVYVVKDAVASFSNSTIDATQKAAVYVQQSKLTLKESKINDVATQGIHVEKSEKANEKVVNIDGVTITNTGEEGIANVGSYVVVKNTTVKETGKSGILSSGTTAITNMNQITVEKAGGNGFGIAGGELTARNVTITEPAKEGINVNAGANVKQLDNVTITKPGTHGIGNYGGTIKITVDTTYNPENTAKNGITITKAGNQGIHNENGTLTANGVTIDDAKAQSLYVTKGSTVKVDNSFINKSGAAAIYVSDSTVTLNKAEVTKPATNGMFVTGGNAKVTVDGITVTEAGTNAIAFEKGTSTVKNAVIDAAKEYGISVLADATANLNNATVKNSGKSAVNTAGTLNITNDNADENGITIAKSGEHGIYVLEGKLDAKGVTISDTAKKGLNICTGDEHKISGLTIMNPTTNALCFEGGKATVSNVEIATESTSAAVRLMNNTEVSFENMNVATPLYGIYLDGTSKAVATNTKLERTKANDKYLLYVGANSRFELKETANGVSSIDGKALSGRGAEVYGTFVFDGGVIQNNAIANGAGLVLRTGATFTMNENAKVSNNNATSNGGGVYAQGSVSFIYNGGTFDGNSATLGKDIYLEGTDTLILAKALSDSTAITIQLPTTKYTEGRSLVVKDSAMSDDAFKASLSHIKVESNDGKAWLVVYQDGKGVLGQSTAKLESTGVVYVTLEDAVAAANAKTGEDTITLLKDVNVKEKITITEDLKIVSDGATVITTTASGDMFEVTSGKLTVKGNAEDAKIILQSSTTTKKIIYVNGGNVELENVELAGNAASTVGTTDAYGIYNNAGTVSAQNVIIKNITKGDGIYVKTGATVNIDNVTITNTSRYGIKTYGTVNISNTKNRANALTIQNTNDHGIDVDNAGQVKSTLTNVPANTKVIKIDTTQKSSAVGIIVRVGGSVDLSDISIKDTASHGIRFYGEDASKASVGKLNDYEITGAGGKEIQIEQVTVTWESNVESNINIGAKIKAAKDSGRINLSKALEANINVTLDSSLYVEGTTVAVKDANMSDADFQNSMKYIKIAPNGTEEWHVGNDGKLVKTGAILTNGSTNTHYATLENAIDAAQAGNTIKILADSATITKQITKAVTITSDKAVTITASDAVTSHMINVTSGNLTIKGKSEDAKIKLVAGTKTKSVIYSNTSEGSLLENVEIVGNKDNTQGNANNDSHGIHNQSGKLIAKNVTIKNVETDGIYIWKESTVEVDNLSIDGTDRYGFTCYGTLEIKNDSNKSQALTVKNTYDHAIDVKDGGSAVSILTNVPVNTKVIKIDTTQKSSAVGIIVRAGASVDLSDISIKNTASHGIWFHGTATTQSSLGKVDNFEVTGAGGNEIKIEKVTMTWESNTESNMNIAEGGRIKLSTALTKNINATLASGSYVAGTEVAVKDANMSDADFQNSMKYIKIAPNGTEEWHIGNDGKLVKTAAILTKGTVSTHYATLDSAIAAANDDSSNTIKLFQDQAISSPITVTKPLKLVSDKSISITATGFTENMFTVNAGATLEIAGKATDKKISISGDDAVKFISNKGTVLLSNVNITDFTTAIYNDGGIVGTTAAPIENVVIDSTNGYSFHIKNGEINVINLEVKNALNQGVRIEGASQTVNMDTVKITDAGAIGFAITNAAGLNSVVTLKNAVIDNAGITNKEKVQGIVANGGVLNLDNVEIKNCLGTKSSSNESYGLLTEGATVIVTAQESNANGEKVGLVIDNVKGHGISVIGSGMVKTDKLRITNAARCGVYITSTSTFEYALNGTNENVTAVIKGAELSGCAANIRPTTGVTIVINNTKYTGTNNTHNLNPNSYQ